MSKENPGNSLSLTLATKVLNLTVHIVESFWGLGYDYEVPEFREDQHYLLTYDSTDTNYIISDYCYSYRAIFNVLDYLKKRDNIKVLLSNKGTYWCVTISKGRKRRKTELGKLLPLTITKCLLKLYL